MGHRQAILACNHSITDQGNQTCYPNMLYINNLSQYAIGQSKAGEVRHAILACNNIGKLSQHAIEANHRLGKLDMLSQHTECRHTIPAYTAKINCIKETAKAENSRQADTVK